MPVILLTLLGLASARSCGLLEVSELSLVQVKAQIVESNSWHHHYHGNGAPSPDDPIDFEDLQKQLGAVNESLDKVQTLIDFVNNTADDLVSQVMVVSDSFSAVLPALDAAVEAIGMLPGSDAILTWAQAFLLTANKTVDQFNKEVYEIPEAVEMIMGAIMPSLQAQATVIEIQFMDAAEKIAVLQNQSIQESLQESKDESEQMMRAVAEQGLAAEKGKKAAAKIVAQIGAESEAEPPSAEEEEEATGQTQYPKWQAMTDEEKHQQEMAEKLKQWQAQFDDDTLEERGGPSERNKAALLQPMKALRALPLLVQSEAHEALRALHNHARFSSTGMSASSVERAVLSKGGTSKCAAAVNSVIKANSTVVKLIEQIDGLNNTASDMLVNSFSIASFGLVSLNATIYNALAPAAEIIPEKVLEPIFQGIASFIGISGDLSKTVDTALPTIEKYIQEAKEPLLSLMETAAFMQLQAQAACNKTKASR